MKIVCKAIEIQSNKMNSKLNGFVELSEEFEVYGICQMNNNLYYLIFMRNDHLTRVPTEMFEIIDSQIGSDWVFTINDNGFSMWNEIFNSPYFFDKFSDFEKNERSLFDRIR